MSADEGKPADEAETTAFDAVKPEDVAKDEPAPFALLDKKPEKDAPAPAAAAAPAGEDVPAAEEATPADEAAVPAGEVASVAVDPAEPTPAPEPAPAPEPTPAPEPAPAAAAPKPEPVPSPEPTPTVSASQASYSRPAGSAAPGPFSPEAYADRPEVLVGAAFVGGLVFAALLKRLGR